MGFIVLGCGCLPCLPNRRADAYSLAHRDAGSFFRPTRPQGAFSARRDRRELRSEKGFACAQRRLTRCFGRKKVSLRFGQNRPAEVSAKKNLAEFLENPEKSIYLSSFKVYSMAYSRTTLPLQQNGIYHLFSRGVGKERVFKEDKDYTHFLEIVSKKLVPLTEIYAYCLIPNHYHFMLKVIEEPFLVSKAIGELGVSYAKWFNIKYDRMGSLFMSPFKRIVLAGDREIGWIPWYIHRNPMHHGITNDWENYQWSSYTAYITGKPTKINTSFLLGFYGGLAAMVSHHKANAVHWLGEDLEG